MNNTKPFDPMKSKHKRTMDRLFASANDLHDAIFITQDWVSIKIASNQIRACLTDIGFLIEYFQLNENLQLREKRGQHNE